jgi:hypothetical protein
MKGDTGYVIRNGKRIETVNVYDPLDHAKPKVRRSKEHFARLTKERQKLLAGASGAAWAIYSYLLTVNWLDLHRPVKLANSVLAELGVSPDAKLRALLQLERAGLVKVKRTGGQAPIVTPLK